MKQKTRILIYILIGAAIVIAGTIIMFAKAAADKKPDVGRHIDLGQKYLIELSYDKAVLEFTEAIEIEPQNPEAYKGLALTYEAMGDTEKAIEWLRKGYDLTGDSSLKAEMDRINAYIHPAETTVITAVTTTVTTTEATTTVTTIATEPKVEYITFNGKKYSTDLTELKVRGRSLESNDISDLKYMTNLEVLSLTYNQISDISALSKLTNLKELNLHSNQISDISALSQLTNLEKLGLSKNQISDISVLSKLINLKELDLVNSQISDISVLSKLTNLENLWLYDNQINDINALSNLTNLEELYLGHNQISDISALSKLTNLKSLDLYGNQISDISALSNLTKLKLLVLEDNQISDKDIEELKEKLPNCRIYF